jgi:hypothetical protein
MQRRKVIGVRRFLMQLRDIAMSGYDVWGERMLGRRLAGRMMWRCLGECDGTVSG